MNVHAIAIPVLLASLGIGNGVAAGTLGPFQERLMEQRQQIDRGIASGRLVPREADRLRQARRRA